MPTTINDRIKGNEQATMTVTPSATPWRKTTQLLMPASPAPMPAGQYDIYPGFPLGPGKIRLGYTELAAQIQGASHVTIDGFPGVLWAAVREGLSAALARLGVEATWYSIDDALLEETAINRRLEPFLGGDDPIFGYRYQGELRDFFAPAQLAALQPDQTTTLHIVYGCGAALANWDGLLIYCDVPKNEIQFRQRAGTVRNLGARAVHDPKIAYKRAYFVDWVVANAHKAELLPRIDLIVDEQRPDEPAIMDGDDLRAGLTAMSRNYFRCRPWFEPGPWGGQWIKARMPQLARDVPNYAWSFELITPENGICFESDGRLLEVSFDLLMFQDRHAVVGESADRFGHEFPIRFDFLDTFDGGNLSVQVHPRPDYIRQEFGELITQDETYYILDCGPDAKVYLGFQEGIDPAAFRTELERSFADGTPIAIERYVNSEAANKHDLFLIPNGTIHCSGKDILVLEISATPYIFTFKMYDWLRLGLDGKPRPLNIHRAFANLYFERQGGQVDKELISHQYVLAQGADWQVIHAPTHPAHFYDVHRLEFSGTVNVSTEGSCHLLSLVEGTTVLLETAQGMQRRFSYAETFVIPAAADSYRLTSENGELVKVVKAFIKPMDQWLPGAVLELED